MAQTQCIAGVLCDTGQRIACLGRQDVMAVIVFLNSFMTFAFWIDASVGHGLFVATFHMSANFVFALPVRGKRRAKDESQVLF